MQSLVWFDCLGESVVRRKAVGCDIDQRYESLSGIHYQSQGNCVSSVYSIYVSDDQTTQTTETPGFKPFTILLYTMSKVINVVLLISYINP